MLILSPLYINTVLAQEEVGKCYEAMPIYYPSIDGKPNKEIKNYEPLGYCVFAWRLQHLGNDAYSLNTTAGNPIEEKAGFLAPLGRLIRAVGPFHQGDKKVPEWLVQKTNPNDPENKMWKVITYGVLTTTKKRYARDNIMCVTDTVENGSGFNYADGCYTYNYSVSSLEPWGYIGIPGLHAGGPITLTQINSAATKDSSVTLDCTSVGPEIARMLVSGESCGKDGKFVMPDPESKQGPDPKRHKTKDDPLPNEN